jgi:hypothetical protein
MLNEAWRMFEILGSIAASEAGKFVLEKGLELGQAAAEDGVKGFKCWGRSIL